MKYNRKYKFVKLLIIAIQLQIYLIIYIRFKKQNLFLKNNRFKLRVDLIHM